MKKETLYTSAMLHYASQSIRERTSLLLDDGDTVITQATGNDICRIITAGNSCFVGICKEYADVIKNYMLSHPIREKIRSFGFHREILDLLHLDSSAFPLEPSEEFLQDIPYRCSHTLEYVCSSELFHPTNIDKVQRIFRDDERYILEDHFHHTMHCVTDNDRIVSTCFYRENMGAFANTCSMEVFTRNDYRNQGYGRMTASSATHDIMRENKLALWCCQVENAASRKIAESLGYVFLGGELRIMA